MFVVLNFIAVILLLPYSKGDGSDSCKKIYRPEMYHCCESPSMVMPSEDTDFADIKHCIPDFDTKKHMHIPLNCEIAKCIAKTKNLLNDDDTINFDALKKVAEHYLPANLIQTIDDNCIHGDMSKYADGADCDIIKLFNCKQFQRLKTCEKWNSGGSCTEMKSIFDECEKSME